MEPLRILILSSSTGGGHDMRARSLKQWCEQCGPPGSIVVTQYQALEDSSLLYRFGVGIYNWIQKQWPALHHLYFNFLELFQISASPRCLLGKARYTTLLKQTQPNIIVSVHAHTNHAFRIIARQSLPGVRFVTYCGEMSGGYGFSRHWADPGADAFIGATPEICQAAVRHKVSPSKTYCGGFLLHPDFYQEDHIAAAKAKRLAQNFDLKPDLFTLLLSTGANGAVNHIAFLENLEESKLRLQVIALCGHNDAAKSAIERLSDGFEYLTIRALSHQTDMLSLMKLSDAIVARPGTGTTSESILAGCPILFNTLGGIMPQEWITVKYLRGQGLEPPLIRRSGDLVGMIQAFLHSPEVLDKARHALHQLHPQTEPRRIVAFLRELALRGYSEQLPRA
jgi:processive 1,2-diacylglycerol beta-glucosyltransferase